MVLISMIKNMGMRILIVVLMFFFRFCVIIKIVRVIKNEWVIIIWGGLFSSLLNLVLFMFVEMFVNVFSVVCGM